MEGTGVNQRIVLWLEQAIEVECEDGQTHWLLQLGLRRKWQHLRELPNPRTVFLSLIRSARLYVSALYS